MHLAGPFTAASTLAFYLALVLWIGDLIQLGFGKPSHGLSSFFFLLLPIVPMGLGLALFLRVVVGPDNPYVRAWTTISRILGFLWRQDRERGFDVGVALVAYSVWLCGSFLMAVVVGGEVAHRVIDPTFQSILTVSGTVCSFALMYTAVLFMRGLGKGMKGGFARARAISVLWDRPIYPVALWLSIVVVVGLLILCRFEGAVEAAPWQTPAWIVGALVVAAVLSAVTTRYLSAGLPNLLISVLLLGLVSTSAVSALSLDTGDSKARRYFLKGRSTSLSWRLMVKIFDKDGDGFMHQFAGGDCRPYDPEVNPAAIDIPANGIDEDCNGGDVQLVAMDSGRWDYPLPSDFPAQRVPVLLITMDAVSASRLSMNGYERETTPNIDELAGRCVVFDNAFAQGPSTRLSIASMFISQFDSQIKKGRGLKVPWPLDDGNVTMAEHFERNGYDTVAVVPNAYFSQRWKGVLQGFEVTDTTALRSRPRAQALHNARHVTDAAVKHIKRHRNAPLFLWAHYFDPHPPFGQPPDSPQFGRDKMDLHDAEVHFVDKQLGRLLEEIERVWQDDEYILILSADHGSAFDANHPKRSHGYDLHTEVLHIPLMLCSGSIPHRHVEQTPVSLMDILPTLVNILDLEVGDVDFEGTSLVPLLFGGNEWLGRVVFHQFFLVERTARGLDPLVAASIRTSQFNYIWERDENEYKLFDYRNDPSEEEDLADSEPELASHLDSMLKSWLYRVHRIYNPNRPGEEQLHPEGHEEGGEDDYIYQ